MYISFNNHIETHNDIKWMFLINILLAHLHLPFPFDFDFGLTLPFDLDFDLAFDSRVFYFLGPPFLPWGTDPFLLAFLSFLLADPPLIFAFLGILTTVLVVDLDLVDNAF